MLLHVVCCVFAQDDTRRLVRGQAVCFLLCSARSFSFSKARCASCTLVNMKHYHTFTTRCLL